MLAVDYPIEAGERLDCYLYGPLTDFGDGLLSACQVPIGGSLEVVSQPSHGTVEFSGGGTGWRFNMSSPPSVNTDDSFTYRVSDGQGNFSTPATVRLRMAVEM